MVQSIDIFESFDELILLRSGGRLIFAGEQRLQGIMIQR